MPVSNRAVLGEDFYDVSGVLTFEHQVSKMTIEIPLFPNNKPREGIAFYVRMLKPTPEVVKVNSKDNGRCRVELVADEASLKKSKAEHQLLEMV